VAACVYCALEAWNVIEVRYARTLKHPVTGAVSDEDSPREILGRGFYVCDGCLALLDFHVEHHLDPGKHSGHNLLASSYHFFVVWMAVAVGSLAGSMALIRDRNFLTMGLLLALACLLSWFLRAWVHTRFYGQWREAREKPRTPRNSLAAFTDLRDQRNPELGHYLPVRFEDSLRLAALPGSPPIRSLGPAGEPWGAGPQTNFPGRGDNEWYRLVWISWRLWPLTHVMPPATPEWRAPRRPYIEELEVAGGTVLAAVGFALVSIVAGQPWWLALPIAGVLWPAGFFAGRAARAWWLDRQMERYGGTAT
jgi:hypothetical protein